MTNSNFNSELNLNLALPERINWSTSDTPAEYDTEGKYPISIGVAIPLESLPALIKHLMNIENGVKIGTIKKSQTNQYDFQKQEGYKVDCIYLNGKGKVSADQKHFFGSINPVAVDSSTLNTQKKFRNRTNNTPDF